MDSSLVDGVRRFLQQLLLTAVIEVGTRPTSPHAGEYADADNAENNYSPFHIRTFIFDDTGLRRPAGSQGLAPAATGLPKRIGDTVTCRATGLSGNAGGLR